jgi:DNA-directed RNA polymerase subunit RPC12/RpoP
MIKDQAKKCEHQYEDLVVEGHSNPGLQWIMLNGRPYVSYVDDTEMETRCVKCGKLYEMPVEEMISEELPEQEENKRTDELITVEQARNIAHKYVCAVCWGPLKTIEPVVDFDLETHKPFIRGTAAVVCADPECSGGGFHSKYYVDLQRANSHYELQDFLRVCGPAVGIEQKQISKEDIDKFKKQAWK